MMFSSFSFRQRCLQHHHHHVRLLSNAIHIITTVIILSSLTTFYSEYNVSGLSINSNNNYYYRAAIPRRATRRSFLHNIDGRDGLYHSSLPTHGGGQGSRNNRHGRRGDGTLLFAINYNNNLNGSSNNNVNGNVNGGKTLSPKQILNHELYLSNHPPPTRTMLNNNKQHFEEEEEVPLYAGIQLLIQSMEQILQSSSSSSSSFNHNNNHNEEESSILDHLRTTSILRIEQSISAVHSIDPLCWLHANQLNIDNLRRELKLQQQDELPVMYFSNAEGTVEATTIGKASPTSKSVSHSWDPFVGKRIWDDNNNGNEDCGNNGVNGGGMRSDDDGCGCYMFFKESELPYNSRIYGASRFDHEYYQQKQQQKKQKQGNNENENDVNGSSETNNNGCREDDWDGFGGANGGYWILPAVELRREVVVDNNTTTAGGGKGKQKKVTLAVHLHNTRTPSFFTSSSSSSSQLNKNNLNDGMQNQKEKCRREGWYDAAKYTLQILSQLSSDISPSVPCTTLPPVITRSESTSSSSSGRDEATSSTTSGDDTTTSSSADDKDDETGLAFERGVTEALKLIQSSSSSSHQTSSKYTTNDDNSSDINEKEERLRKVVLARKVDLNLESQVYGIDVLMRMKFGGHIGHLFYLNPGTDESIMQRKINGVPGSKVKISSREFIGCTPERLFKIQRSDDNDDNERIVTSEALAGTRIRGLTPKADAELLQDLLSSRKDMMENEITGDFIRRALQELEMNGWLEKSSMDDPDGDSEVNGDQKQRYFVRRLRHLQHICQTFEGKLSKNANVIGKKVQKMEFNS